MARLLYVILAFFFAHFNEGKHKVLFKHFGGIFTANNQQEQYPWKMQCKKKN